jgi:hypothetical protein
MALALIGWNNVNIIIFALHSSILFTEEGRRGIDWAIFDVTPSLVLPQTGEENTLTQNQKGFTATVLN